MAARPPTPHPKSTRQLQTLLWSGDNTDLVIRTSSGPCYMIEKCFLISASSFFRNLFADSIPEETLSSRPVYDVPEDSETTQWILNLIYPMDLPRRKNCDGLSKCAEALKKYMMEAALKRLEDQMLVSHVLELEPMRVFAIARHFEWKHLAAAAVEQLVHQTLGTATTSLVPELGLIPASDLVAIQRIQSSYQLAVIRALQFVPGPDLGRKKNEIFLVPFNMQGSPALSMRSQCLHCAEHMSFLVAYEVDHSSSVELMFVHSWVVFLLRGALAAVRKSGTVGAIMDDDLRVKAALQVRKAGCKTQTVAALNRFIKIVEDKVTLAVSRIKLDIDSTAKGIV